MTMLMTPKQKKALKANWRSILPRELVLDILIAQGYTRKAAQAEVLVSHLSKGHPT